MSYLIDTDLFIAATALYHDLTVVTHNNATSIAFLTSNCIQHQAAPQISGTKSLQEALQLLRAE
jgi:hypothetical protein